MPDLEFLILTNVICGRIELNLWVSNSLIDKFTKYIKSAKLIIVSLITEVKLMNQLYLQKKTRKTILNVKW